MAGLYIWNASPMGVAHPYFFLFFVAKILKINDLYCFTLCKSETKRFLPMFVQVRKKVISLPETGFCPLFVCSLLFLFADNVLPRTHARMYGLSNYL